MRPSLLMALAGTLIVASCVAPIPAAETGALATITPAPTTTAPAQPLAWSQCGVQFECADLRVPLDYSEPDGATITLALVRHRSGDPTQRIGSIVVNPGGPGASGVEAVRQNSTRFTPEVMARFDIVGFDPRGVGQSSAVHCLETRPELNHAFPADESDVAEFVHSAKAVAAACQANSGDLLPYVGTESVAADLDRIRAALGDDTLTYVGSSYGTLIGALYAEMFPTHIRAMVLDGPVDPSLDMAEFITGQAIGSQRQLDKFLAGCAAETGCAFHSDGNPGAAFDALMERFAEGPIGGVTAQVAWGAVYWELTVDDTRRLAADLQAASLGDTTPLEDAAGWMFEPYALDAYEAVNCADYRAPRTPEGFAEMAADAVRVAPDFGAAVAYGYFDCVYWPYESERDSMRVTAGGAKPILVIAATGDPATPYEWGQSLASQLSSGVLVTRDGDGHTSLENWCIAQLAESYLLTLATPEPGTTCT